MVTVRNKSYIGKPGKGKVMNVPMSQTGMGSAKKGGKLTKDGLVYKNSLLDADFTDQRATRRKLKAG